MTKKLGVYIKENYSGKKALVIIDPYVDENDCPPLDGLRDGLGKDVEIVEIFKPEVPAKPEGSSMLAPETSWYTCQKLDKQLYGKKFDICITLIGLPIGTKVQGKELNIKALADKKVFIGGGSIYTLKMPIQSGAIIAAVSNKSDAIYDDEPIPSKLDEAFNKRFAFVTADNVEQYKTLFKN